MATIRNKPYTSSERAIVYLAATPIGNIDDVSKRFLDVVKEADIIACEDTRNTALLLSRLGIKEKKLVSCYSQGEVSQASRLIDEVKNKNLVLVYVSDAGTPGISDPGSLLIKEAIERGVNVSSLPGPCAFIQALILSSFDTSDFSFYGFLPAKSKARKDMLETLKDREETLIFYEAPHRLQEMLLDLKEVFGGERRVSLSREITKIHEEHIYGTLDEVCNDNTNIRGEFVIVVEGDKKKDEVGEDIGLIKAKKLLDLGLSKKDVASYLSEDLKINKNFVYSLIKGM